MTLTPQVKAILDQYESDNPGTKTNLARFLNAGKLGGTGKLVILPVDQGFEHGPARSFAANPAAYDPHYHFELAIEAGLSGYAAPLGMLECGAAKYAAEIPLILKCNSSNSLATEKDQAVTGTVADALRLGCAGIGFTIYPGSEYCFDQMEEFRELAAEAKAAGLAVILWSYPRGPLLDKPAETAVDVCAYAAHMAALCGAHIIKVKPPTDLVALPANKPVYEQNNIDISTLPARIRHVVQSTFAGRRIVIFSGGEKAGTDNLLTTIKGIQEGGGFGSIIGRNVFQRPKAEALDLLNQIITIFKKLKQLDVTTGQGAGMTAYDVYLATPVLRDVEAFLPDLARGMQQHPPAAVLLRLADAPDAELIKHIQTIQSVVHAQDIALMLEDRPALAARTGCDGVHLSTGFAEASVKDVRKQIGDDPQLGVSVGGSRDAAMRAGEAGADYISFSTAIPVVPAEGEAPESLTDLVRWWCLVMELPAVVEVEEPAQITAFEEVGADFIQPGPAFWENPSLWP